MTYINNHINLSTSYKVRELLGKTAADLRIKLTLRD